MTLFALKDDDLVCTCCDSSSINWQLFRSDNDCSLIGDISCEDCGSNEVLDLKRVRELGIFESHI
ncbi:hypothetical protein [Vibrio algivorus]|uniref:Uncharacterized protein n=1 Tax=Vibrio algivorus TaxID=1667024 RepID=A0ABQ6EM33_9VIBR|nr:hypothetical protein [Vibrio algivorus]GLT14046.1 hypothetical protein GCM10007931_10200 [Vibrio algivorus]